MNKINIEKFNEQFIVKIPEGFNMKEYKNKLYLGISKQIKVEIEDKNADLSNPRKYANLLATTVTVNIVHFINELDNGFDVRVSNPHWSIKMFLDTLIKGEEFAYWNIINDNYQKLVESPVYLSAQEIKFTKYLLKLLNNRFKLYLVYDILSAHANRFKVVKLLKYTFGGEFITYDYDINGYQLLFVKPKKIEEMLNMLDKFVECRDCPSSYFMLRMKVFDIYKRYKKLGVICE